MRRGEGPTVLTVLHMSNFPAPVRERYDGRPIRDSRMYEGRVVVTEEGHVAVTRRSCDSHIM